MAKAHGANPQAPHRSHSRLPDVEPLPPMSPPERVARGIAARGRVPLARHGMWRPGQDRPDPLEILARQAATRDASLVPMRYGRMAASPFAFFRGAAAIMAKSSIATAAAKASQRARRKDAMVPKTAVLLIAHYPPA